MARSGKVTVVGAGFYGSTTAQRLAEYDIFETVVLTDIIEGKPEGLALDLNQSRPIEGFETKVVGQTTGTDGSGYEAIAGSDVVVITAGLPRKPGMSRMDLIETNAKIVRSVAENVARHAPDAVVIVVSNPLDEMTALTQIATGFRRSRGDRPGRHARHRPVHLLRRRGARRPGRQRADADARLARRHDGAGAVAGARSTASRWPTCCRADKIEELVDRTRNGGAEVVALLKTGSAYYAPSAAAARMARAVIEDSGAVMPVCAWVDGEYGISGVYLGVEAEIGARGRTPGRRDRPDRVGAGRAARGGRGGPGQAGRRRSTL